ncbi:Short chain dehydrogenases/reductase notP' [Pseudocercospora fuligena]|uniref:Short chain dehydrogenases/reductase notP n=1 Tax=Pseudocercospora fuligena TaxID=685502 RepID=A0A8H6RS86_9PEZI|nr:Short chain dehydrogenases/reductase notP' [Pseudocercospora fuligena]
MHNEVGSKRLADFDLKGRVFLVTGGASGIVYTLDRAPKPSDHWEEAKRRVKPEWGGELHYARVDVSKTQEMTQLINDIAESNQRLDGLMAAAAIQQVTPAIDYEPEDLMQMMAVNYNGVFMAAQATAKQMMRFKCHGSICIVASMSGIVANKGLLSPVYNSSKAALIQLARNLAMEWSPIKEDGTGGIRVNCLSPGHTLTPMVEKNLRDQPGTKEKWESENMMGRLASPEEFKGAGLFLLSRASSFMTGNNLVIDGGHTGW